eukprot:COSAG05_NODE_536_length_8861_cov_4.614700_3_plen_46_part_00
MDPSCISIDNKSYILNLSLSLSLSSLSLSRSLTNYSRTYIQQFTE